MTRRVNYFQVRMGAAAAIAGASLVLAVHTQTTTLPPFHCLMRFLAPPLVIFDQAGDLGLDAVKLKTLSLNLPELRSLAYSLLNKLRLRS